MLGLTPISPPLSFEIQTHKPASALDRLTWQKNDLPVPPTHPSTNPGWRGRVQNWLRRIFPPSDVKLARTIEEYQLRLAANDLRGSGKCAYRLGNELWIEKRYSTAEQLWYTGASHFIAAEGQSDPRDVDAILNRLISDQIINPHPLLWDGDREDFIVQSRIGAGNQGEASKLFGKDLVLKTPRSLVEMDPRSSPCTSSRDLRTFRRLNLGREIESMLELQKQGFRIAEIHYVHPDYHFCIKDLIIGPNIRGLYHYGLTEAQIKIALARHDEFMARNPVVDNINSNVLYDVNAGEWTIIDA